MVYLGSSNDNGLDDQKNGVTNRMFPLRMRANLKNGEEMVAVTQEAFQREAKYENWLWHLRFGHLNFGGLNLFNRK